MRLDAAIRIERGRFSLDVDFSLEGESFGLAGPTGSGKTSLLHALAGLAKPTAGRIAMNGRALYDSRKRVFVPAHERGIGVVFQEGRLFPHMSAQDNILYAPGARGEARAGLFQEIVEAFRLASLLGSRPARLSGGERQRVAIARALMAEPRVLLLDEPFSSQDAASRARATSLVRMLIERWKIPILIVSHDERDFKGLADSVICLKEGRITAWEETT
jgi:molybdate transport system ATP-binding protein